MGEDVLLPEGSLLLHIGPHKTGTTAIQSALRFTHKALLEYGVVHVGNERPLVRQAVLAMTGRPGLRGERGPKRADWDRLVRRVRDTKGSRCVVSSEFMADADAAAVVRMVGDLGLDRIHVVVTLRPLAKILPSAWQQYVRNQLRMPYEKWLRRMLEEPPYEKPTPTFWQRHRHDELVARWAGAVGAQNLTVIVLDETDRMGLMHTFEDLLGVPRGILVPEEGLTNRSLTAGETELIRQLNVAFYENDWPNSVYHDVVRQGAMRLMGYREVDPQEARIVTPSWALERAAEVGRGAAAGIAALGVRVIGDLATLGTVPDEEVKHKGARKTVPVDVARDAVIGAMIACHVLDPTIGPEAVLAARPDLDESRAVEIAARDVGRLLRRTATRRRVHAGGERIPGRDNADDDLIEDEISE